MADKSLDIHKNLTTPEIPEDNLEPESDDGDKGLSIKDEEELDEKTKQGFQRLVAKKEQEAKELKLQLEEANRKAEAYEAAKKEQELAEMTEAERMKTERDEYATKFAKSELKSFVTGELMKRNLMTNPLAEDIIESPWMLRAVKSHLSVQPDWEETIDAVKEYLPAYLDTLIVPAGNEVASSGDNLPDESSDNPPTPMPSERGEPAITPGNKRTWTKAEIAEIQKDTEKWLKYREAITLAYQEGRVI